VRKILSIFGAARRSGRPASGFWNIDLKSLGGRIMVRSEAVNLPGKKKQPRVPAHGEAAAAAPPQRRDEAAKLARMEANAVPRPARYPDDAGGRPVRTASAPPAAAAPRRRDEAASTLARVDANTAPRQARYPDDAGGAPVRSGSAPLPKPRTRDHGAARQPAREGYLATHSLEKSFGGRKVVRGTSLYVRRGEAVGLLGPNGAGKTTVFYMITGLIKADRGRIELDGHDITRLPMYQRARLGIGYLPQEASIFRGLNVEENIRAVLEVVEPKRRRREADLTALLDEFGITRLRKTPTLALSGGERRRVEIARALASRPNYMLLDEPFAGIDPIAVGDIQKLVRHLTNRGIGVLITDHNVRETLGLVDRAYVIYSGEVLMEGRADDIVNDPEVRARYLGEGFRM
jgi:lipopolysaccharide export system ATP-binding protein